MSYILTWAGDRGAPMRAELPSAEETIRHARAMGAPGIDVNILFDGQTLTFDELLRIVMISRRA
jgi:hypothetical protein